MSKGIIVDKTLFQRFIEHDNHETRERLKIMGKDPIFIPKYNIPLSEIREHTLQKLRKVAETKEFSISDFESNPLKLYAMHEVLAYIDFSLSIKFTAHFGLCIGSIYSLSKRNHNEILSKLLDTSILGSFCLTELGFGNNTFQMETTATYDPLTKEFIINSPTTLSKKYLMANGGCHASVAVVFAQTIVKGENEGVNAFLVKIRENDKTVSKNVYIEDIGMKMQANGLDNGKITFKNARIPYTSLLNKYSDINPETGEFSSSISKKRERFTKAINELIGGRLSITSTMISSAKLSLFITIKFSKNRFGVGPDGKSSTAIFDYQLQKLALIPLLAQLVAYNVAFNRIKDIYADPKIIYEEKSRLCCIIKALVAWFTVKAGTICRERCGGQGFLSVNRVDGAIGFGHGGVTGEGDNVILYQKVSKELLTDLKSKIYQLPQMKNSVNQLKSSKTLVDLGVLRDLLVFRELFFIKQLKNTLETRISKGISIFQILMKESSILPQKLGSAYGERVVIDACILSLDQPDARINREALHKLYCLHGLVTVQNDLAFYLMNDLISNEQAESIERNISDLVEEISTVALEIVESLGLPEYLVRSPIAENYIKYNESTNLGEYKNLPKL